MSFFRRLTDERGVALPVALAVLFTVAGLATVAARAAIVSNNQSFRDNNAKRAVQAANAGLQAAVYQTNLLQPSCDAVRAQGRLRRRAVERRRCRRTTGARRRRRTSATAPATACQVSPPATETTQHGRVRRPAQGRVLPGP